MDVVEIDIERVVPYARNPRRNDGAVVAVAASIAEFGWRQPIVVDEQMVIVAGHTRYEAAKRLGMKIVPVHVAKGLSAAQLRAYRLMDNRSHQNASWDDDLLGLELQDLRLEEFDLSLTGFDDTEIERLLAESVDGAGDADEAPEPPAEPISRPGDLWICGEHRVLCGDATVLSDVETLLGGELADMCFCDPPYNVNYANGSGEKRGGKARPILNDALGETFGALLYDACVNILSVTKGAVYICMSSSELDTLQKAFREAGGHWSTFVIWAKNTFTLGRSDYQRQYEPILYGWKEGVDHYWCGARDQGDVWYFDKPVRNDLHPTMKPVGLAERAIRNSSKSRDIVLDPFGGSGTTMIAAERSGRRARLIELDPKYVDVIVARWQVSTSKTAVLADGGQSFEELGRERGVAVAA
jgi:DNA modification methylase